MTRLFHIEVYTASEGLKAEITVSPSLWSEVVEQGGHAEWVMGGSESLSMEFSLDGPGGLLFAYALAGLKVLPGTESYDDPSPAPDYEDDEGLPFKGGGTS